MTRAANDNNSNYKVYAVWSGATNSNWFINDVANGTTNLPQNGPYYWPTTGTVDFTHGLRQLLQQQVLTRLFQ